MNAQQLKNAILQEAIEGRLVPQDPNDEPASALLERIRKEKEELVKAGKLKKKDLEVKPISEDEIPFEIPESWEWVRLKSFVQFINGDRGKNYPSKDKLSTEGEIPFISAANINENDIPKNELLYLSQKQYDALSQGKLKKNDVVLCIRGSLGKTAIYPYEKGAIASSLVILRNIGNSYNNYVLWFLKTPLFYCQINNNDNGTAQPNLSADNVANFLVPLPPLAEQKRIVAKIEELLPKVEEYGKAQEKLNKLNEELPERLKKSVLQEAIEGRLVPQDPNDEPASALLAKIREEKKQLVKECKLKKKDLEEKPISEDEIPFEIPESWEWCRLADYLDVRDGTHDSPKYYSEGIPFVTSKNLDNGKIDFATCKYISEEDHKKFSERSYVEDGDILFAMIGSIGNPVIVKKDREFSIKNVALFKRYSVELTNYQYIYYYLLFIQNELKKISSGGVQSFVGLKTFREWIFPLPPLAEQHRIVKKLEQLLGEIDKLKK